MTTQDFVLLISAISAATVAILGAIGALWAKVHGYSAQVNGRLTELLTLTSAAAEARGRLGSVPPASGENALAK